MKKTGVAPFVHDSATALRNEIISPQERHLAEVTQMLKEEQRNCIYAEDGDLNPANPEYQLGKSLTDTELETKLRPLLPANCIFIDNPRDATKKAIVRQRPDGTLETICSYERGVMPEHSIMRIQVEDVKDPGTRHIDRADLPKYEYVPGSGIVWMDDSPKPGYVRVKKLWGEKTRGWRTVLIRLIQSRLLTLSDAERVFGADIRPQWAAGTGKQELLLPW